MSELFYEDVWEAVRANWFSLGELVALEPVSNEHAVHSKNFVVSVGASDRYVVQKYLLKKVVAGLTEEIERSAEIQEYCNQMGAPTPAMIRRSDGGGLVATIGGSAYTMQEYHDGVPFTGTLEEIESVALSLAQLHRTLRGLPYNVPDASIFGDLSSSELSSIRGEVIHGETSPFTGKVSQIIDELPLIYTLFEPITTYRDVPRQAVHLDCHVQNVIFPSKHDAVVLDFGNIFYIEKMLAVSFACHRFAGFTPSSVQTFLNAYQRIDPLAPEELYLFPLFVAREAIRRVNKVLRSHFFERNERWDFELTRQFGFWQDAMEQFH